MMIDDAVHSKNRGIKALIDLSRLSIEFNYCESARTLRTTKTSSNIYFIFYCCDDEDPMMYFCRSPFFQVAWFVRGNVARQAGQVRVSPTRVSGRLPVRVYSGGKTIKRKQWCLLFLFTYFLA